MQKELDKITTPTQNQPSRLIPLFGLFIGAVLLALTLINAIEAFREPLYAPDTTTQELRTSDTDGNEEVLPVPTIGYNQHTNP